jgi:hypothetical protein
VYDNKIKCKIEAQHSVECANENVPTRRMMRLDDHECVFNKTPCLNTVVELTFSDMQFAAKHTHSLEIETADGLSYLRMRSDDSSM